MKVVKASEMGRIEKKAYAEGASEETFMNQAGSAIAAFIEEHFSQKKILLLCGKGNNAGDAYVVGQILKKKGFAVSVYACFPLEECSPLCKLQAKRFTESGGKIEKELHFEEETLLVDGLLGTGFKGEVTGILKSVIERANASKLKIVAIDIPSGLTGIKATLTTFLGLPKSECFIGEAWNNVGEFTVLPFGLAEKYIEEAKPDFMLLEEHQIKTLLPEIVRVRHKYDAGLVMGLGGSPGMPGAAILTSEATLKTGAGMVRLLHPKEMAAELSGAPYEIIRIGYRWSESVAEELNKGSAIFIGPGIGVSRDMLRLLKRTLPKISKPCVIDAEALTLIAEHSLPIPQEAILTPHLGECRRLLKIGKEVPLPEIFKLCQKYAEENGVVLVLKGAPTFIFQGGKKPHISPRGDPGMATAGSGDVLTGIIAALLAQKKTPFEAATLGVYLHGMAGERAAEKFTSYSMVASDITDSLSEVFKTLIPLHKLL